jgi:hypothetical protein
MPAPRDFSHATLAAALVLSTCFGSKKSYENWSNSVPAGRFRTLATIAGGDGRNDLRMSVQVRNDLHKAGINAIKVSGRWENITQAISQVCSPTAAQPVDGIVVVKYDYLVLYDCKTGKAAFEMQGSSDVGLTTITQHLVKYLKRTAPNQ